MKNLKIDNNVFFLFKYWLPLFKICIIYVLVVTSICYSVNFKNDTLEKRTGIITDFKMDVIPTRSWTWYIMNFKIEGDTTIYAQEWRIINFSFLRYFLLGNKKIQEGIPFNKGSKVEFYTDKIRKSYPYIVIENVEKPENNDSVTYKSASLDFLRSFKQRGKYSLQKSKNEDVIRTYGLTVNSEKVFNYTKRGFATPLLGRMLIGLLILLMLLLIITGLFISMLLSRLIDKLPFKI